MNEQINFKKPDYSPNEDFEKCYGEYFDFFLRDIDEMNVKIREQGLREEFSKNKLKKQIEFIRFCEKDHPEDFNILKEKILKVKTFMEDRGWNLDDILFDF